MSIQGIGCFNWWVAFSCVHCTCKCLVRDLNRASGVGRYVRLPMPSWRSHTLGKMVPKVGEWERVGGGGGGGGLQASYTLVCMFLWMLCPR